MSILLALLAATSPAATATVEASAGATVYPPAFFAAAQPTTALDMVNRIPGFTFDGGDSVRGFAGAASNVLIDGERPASKSDGVDSILGRIPASDVERIELIRGGAPGIDMHGRTVMANVIRKKTATTQVTISAQENLFDDGHTVPGGSILFTKRVGAHTFEGQLSRYASLDDSVGDGRITTIPTGGPATTQNARTKGQGGGIGFMGSYKGPELGGAMAVNLKVEETYFHSGLAYGLPPTTSVLDRSRGRDGEIGVNYGRDLGPVHLDLTALQRLERDSANEISVQPGDQAYFGQNTRTGESIVRAGLRYAAKPWLTLEGGGEAVYNFLDSNQHYIDNGAAIVLPSSDVSVNEKRGELFGQATWNINPKLTLEAGARFEFSEIAEHGDASNSRTFFYPKPRLLLTWDALPGTQVRLRVERKLGQLNFSNFVSAVDLKTGGQVNAGNPDLRPDDHWQYEAAVEQRFWGKGSVVITALHEEIADVSDYIPLVGSNPPIDGPGNIGKGTSDQLDIEGTLPLDRMGLLGGQLKTTTIWRTSEVTDPVTHQSRRISGQRPDVLQATLQQDLPQWKSKWSLTWFKGWRETFYRLEEIDRYHLGNQYFQLEWDYKPNPNLLISVQADNLGPFTFARHRTLWNGPRDVSPVAEEEYRAIRSQPRLWFKIRKTL